MSVTAKAQATLDRTDLLQPFQSWCRNVILLRMLADVLYECGEDFVEVLAAGAGSHG